MVLYRSQVRPVTDDDDDDVKNYPHDNGDRDSDYRISIFSMMMMSRALSKVTLK